MKVEVRIDRLLVDGVVMRPVDIPVFQRAVEAELGRLIADGALTLGQPDSRSQAALGGESVTPGARALGTAAAGVVYRGIER
jgi:hypothetical protein